MNSIYIISSKDEMDGCYGWGYYEAWVVAESRGKARAIFLRKLSNDTDFTLALSIKQVARKVAISNGVYFRDPRDLVRVFAVFPADISDARTQRIFARASQQAQVQS